MRYDFRLLKNPSVNGLLVIARWGNEPSRRELFSERRPAAAIVGRPSRAWVCEYARIVSVVARQLCLWVAVLCMLLRLL